MTIKRLTIISLYLFVFFASTILQAEIQTIFPSASNFEVSTGDTIEFEIQYSATSPQNTTGLGMKIYYDSKKLSLLNSMGVFATDLFAHNNMLDSNDGDNDETTDKVINIAWAGINGNWPGTKTGDTILIKLQFLLNVHIPSSTSINFTGDASAQNTFSSTAVKVTSLDASIRTKSENGSIPWSILFFLVLLLVIRLLRHRIALVKEY